MAKTQALRIKQLLSEDPSGQTFAGKDGSGQRVHLRKPVPGSADAEALDEKQRIAYQVAIERLRTLDHPSLLQVISGGTDPKDGLPYVAIKPVEAVSLADKLKDGPLSIGLTTTLLSQALEACDLISHFLVDGGVWIDTHPENIGVTGEDQDIRFLFWVAPLKGVHSHHQLRDYSGIIELTQRALNWKDREIDDREEGHIQLWLKWLEQDGHLARIHDAREMLAAAAGIEPPQNIEQLIAESQRKPGAWDGMSKMPGLLKKSVPKMPLFTILCVMLVIQAIIGWVVVRKVNESTDETLNRMNSDYWQSPYTIDNQPGRENERGSQPVRFD